MTQPTTLYRLFDADGRLLYVGITKNTLRRFAHHEATKAWWGDVASSTLEHLDDRASAAAAETAAIKNELPLHNLVHNARGSFTGWLRTQTKREDRIGAFASDMLHDRGWPTPGTVDSFLVHLHTLDAAPDFDLMESVLYDAWSVYLLGDREPTIAAQGRFSDRTPWWARQLSILTTITADTAFPVGLTDEAVAAVEAHNAAVIIAVRAEGYEGDIAHGPGPAVPILLSHTDNAPAALALLEQLVVDSHRARDAQFGNDPGIDGT